jgi:flagellar hook-basal body complex protein FliE
MLPAVPIPVSLFGAPQIPAGASAGTPAGAVPVAVSVAPGAFAPVGSISPEDSSSAPFASLVTEAVGQVEKLEKQAKASIEGLISGQGVDVHEAMIAAQKAGMGFELVLAVRNKALAAYQQVLGMQF